MWAFAKGSPLLTAKTDWLTIGGLSVILLPLFFLLTLSDAQITNFSWIMYAVAFVVNYPHFMVSYQLLYSDHKKFITKKPAFIWAAIVVPILLIGYFLVAILAEQLALLSWGVQAMFVLVGWHYTKQAYGVVMVTASKAKYYFSEVEKWALKINMYSLWLTSMSSFNIGENNELAYWGIPYASLNLSKNWLYTGYALTAMSLVAVGVLLLRRIWQERQLPPVNSIIGFSSIYAWYLPILFHPAFFIMVPFFHSIQYFTFVGAYKKNATKMVSSSKKRTKQLASYFLISILLGALFFEIAPRIMDVGIHYKHAIFGEGLFLFCFSVAINIHHYFIDNVIWRHNNPSVKQHLFAE